jgi:heptaprenylglyceryl phosphate synthase
MKKLIVFCLAVLLVGSCTFDNLKPFDEMSAKEKAAFFMSVYNSSDMNYRAMASQPDLTEVQKEILRQKKQIMIQVYPLIQSYNTYVDSGVVPSVELEQNILTNIDKLTTLVVE